MHFIRLATMHVLRISLPIFRRIIRHLLVLISKLAILVFVILLLIRLHLRVITIIILMYIIALLIIPTRVLLLVLVLRWVSFKHVWWTILNVEIIIIHILLCLSIISNTFKRVFSCMDMRLWLWRKHFLIHWFRLIKTLSLKPII